MQQHQLTSAVSFGVTEAGRAHRITGQVRYTARHKQYSTSGKATKEVDCADVMYLSVMLAQCQH